MRRAFSYDLRFTTVTVVGAAAHGHEPQRRAVSRLQAWQSLVVSGTPRALALGQPKELA
jgi:hypothetical protein